MQLLKTILSLTLLSCFFMCFPAHADDIYDDTAESSVDHTPTYPLYDGMTLISQIKTSYATPKITVKAVYPELQSDMADPNIDAFNELVTQLVEDETNLFQNRVLSSTSTSTDDVLPKKTGRSTLYIDYDTSVVKSGKEHLISIRFSIQGYLAKEPHPFHYHRVLNYDLDTGAKVELADLFQLDSNYLSLLANYTSNQLGKQSGTQHLTGPLPNPENYQNWNLKSNGLLMTFDEAQTGSTTGTETVLIPYAIIKPLISSTSPLAGCLKHLTRCVRSNLLTGGFIDEAINNTHSHHHSSFLSLHLKAQSSIKIGQL